ncbi:hypothetical protein BC829DRAFT_421902 [Chytridium lagenaria]|nr:hypothetical protein BC829DRAFT_421902 [Chytridium lagenaria]
MLGTASMDPTSSSSSSSYVLSSVADELYDSARSSLTNLFSLAASSHSVSAPSSSSSSTAATPNQGLGISSQQRALIPAHFAAALDKYEVLSSAISALHPIQKQIPIQKRFISNIRNVLELEKRELDASKKFEAQLKSLQTLSFSSVAAKLNGNLDQRVHQATREIEFLKKAEEKVKKGIEASSEKLLTAVIEAAELDEKSKDVDGLRKELKTLFDDVFEGDKEDESIRLKITSLRNNLKSTLDELDRHAAAESELKNAVKYMEAAILILKVLIDYDTHEEFVVARFLVVSVWNEGGFFVFFWVEAKEMMLRAEILTQNAFSIDALLPEHQDIPEPDTTNTHNPSLKIRAIMIKVQGKLDQIHQTLNYIFESTRPLRPRAKVLAQQVVDAETELAVRRVEVMENCVEVVCGGGGEVPPYSIVDHGSGSGVGRRRILDALVLVEVAKAVDVDARRPTPSPSRIVSSVPTVSETLPVYQP